MHANTKDRRLHAPNASRMARQIVLEDAASRAVFLHFHLMKNAGTTLVSILEREFGNGFYEVHRASSVGAIRAEDVRGLLAATPDARALSSHHVFYPMPAAEDIEVFDCCPVRHPIDRLVSLYAFYRAFPVDTFPSGLAASVDLRTFLSTLLERHPNYVYNVQTVALARGGRFGVLSDRDAAEAEEIVRRSATVAVVHRFDESLAVAEYFLRPAFPTLRLHYVAQNVTRPFGTDFRTREARLREQCGATLYERLARANELDLRVLAGAEDELDRRIALVPDFPERLHDFRARCRALEAAAI